MNSQGLWTCAGFSSGCFTEKAPVIENDTGEMVFCALQLCLSMGALPIVAVTGSFLVSHCRKIKTSNVCILKSCLLPFTRKTIIKEQECYRSMLAHHGNGVWDSLHYFKLGKLSHLKVTVYTSFTADSKPVLKWLLPLKTARCTNLKL